MSPTGPRYPTVAADGGGGSTVWTNPNNAKALDGVFATNVWASAGLLSNPLNLTGYGFSLPSTAIIDGIFLEVYRQGSAAADKSIRLLKAGVATGTDKSAGVGYPSIGTPGWATYGGAADLWGTTWTYADINNANFGASIQAVNTHGGGEADIDAARITVYWHTAPTDVPIRYQYQVFNNGQYLGDLPNVTTPFQFVQEINTAGVQISVSCGVSPDTAILPNTPILDETGAAVLDEAGNPIYDQGTASIVEPGAGSGSRVIRNGNKVVVTEVNYWNPNGKVVFRGVIQNWQASFGDANNSEDITVIIYSDGIDMDNHLVRGNPYTYLPDQSQGTYNSTFTVATIGGGFTKAAQTFTVGSVTNLARIDLAVLGAANVTLKLYDSPGMGILLGTASFNNTSPYFSVITLTFSMPISVSAGTQLFFTVEVDGGQSTSLYYQNTNIYSSGTMYTATFGGSGGGGYVPNATQDLFFETFSGNGSTTATYTGVDPINGMVKPIMDSYIQEGGKILYTPSTLQSTSLSINYKFNTNTIYEMLQAALSVCPNGYCFTVDLGTNILTFAGSNTTPDITLIKGYHISSMTLGATIEHIVNSVFLTGATVSGSNIYATDNDAISLNRYGYHLDRPTNNFVTDTTTAHIITKAELASKRNEQYQTTVTLPYRKIDFTTVKPGMTVGFTGFGSFVDNLVLQIVQINRTPYELTLTLGTLPKRLHTSVEQTVRGYIGLQTVDNPTSPS